MTDDGERAGAGGFDLLLAVPLLVVIAAVALVLLALAVRLSPAELLAALTSLEARSALALSLWTSALALAISAALSVPAGYLLARRRLPAMIVVDTLIDLPLVMPPLVAGVGLLFLLGRHSPVPGLADAGLAVLFSPAGIVVAQAFVASAMLLRSAKAAFAAIAPDYREAAATLGVPPALVFLIIDLPLAARGLAAGAILAWARALGEFGATLMVAGATRLRTETLPMAVFLNIATGDTDVAVATALLLLMVAFVLLFLFRLVGRS